MHRHALVNLPQEKRVVFPSETLTAGAEVRSSAYEDLRAGVIYALDAIRLLFDIRHALRTFQSARPMGAFPRETLTAGTELRSRSYEDFGAGIRA